MILTQFKMDENDLAYTQHICRYWSMLITQIPCSSAMLHTASPGCRQYLTGVTGTLQSFNFANTNNPQLLQGQGTWHTWHSAGCCLQTLRNCCVCGQRVTQMLQSIANCNAKIFFTAV